MGRSRVLVYHTQTGQTLYNEVNSKQQEGSERRSCSIATGESAISAEDLLRLWKGNSTPFDALSRLLAEEFNRIANRGSAVGTRDFACATSSGTP